MLFCGDTLLIIVSFVVVKSVIYRIHDTDVSDCFMERISINLDS